MTYANKKITAHLSEHEILTRCWSDVAAPDPPLTHYHHMYVCNPQLLFSINAHLASFLIGSITQRLTTASPHAIHDMDSTWKSCCVPAGSLTYLRYCWLQYQSPLRLSSPGAQAQSGIFYLIQLYISFDFFFILANTLCLGFQRYAPGGSCSSSSGIFSWPLFSLVIIPVSASNAESVYSLFLFNQVLLIILSPHLEPSFYYCFL